MNDETIPRRNSQILHESEPMADGRRTLKERSDSSIFNASQIFFQADFQIAWDVITKNPSPKPFREGESITFDYISNNIYFAYGEEANEKYSDSVYVYNISKDEWRKFDVQGTKPKSYCGSTYGNNKLWFYGGCIDNDLLQDMHYIDLETNKVVYPETKGPAPPRCHSPLVFYHNNNLIVWSPSTRSSSSSLHILNIETLVWSKIETEHIYRVGARGSIVGDCLYIIGATDRSDSVISLNLKDYSLTIIQATGEDPPTAPESMFVRTMGSYLVLVSSSIEEKVPWLYFFTREKNSWLKIAYAKRQLLGTIVAFFANRSENKLYLVLNLTSDESKERSVDIAVIDAGIAQAYINHELDMIKVLY